MKNLDLNYIDGHSIANFIKISLTQKKGYSYKHKLNYLKVKLTLEILRLNLTEIGINLGKIIKKC